MIRNLFVWLLLSGATLALAACCGNVPCDKQDDYADALFFKFNLDSTSTQGFRRKDIDTVYLKRYSLPDTVLNTKPTVETIRLLRPQRQDSLPIIINNNTPFTAANNRKLNSYRYTLFVVRYPATSKPKIIDTVRFVLDNIKLDTRLEGEGCCMYYRNLSKIVEVSEMRQFGMRQNTVRCDVTKKNGQDQPITLNRF
ncbi:hypothetical protein [Hymenobacter cavernae]|uniref:Lipoprotein n=1 Tax=Hymenobacter cavernae TaxID=2044852 RepID=A0ABQ1UHS0_9BACT|nr:hypothetical protein [Hymenobacter cavernae]GGF19369.1 hypothetical protein GCM10011383_33680 [Hymenobacter cavernae]